MFYYLEGVVSHLEPSIAVIDCGGVGYECHVSVMTQSRLKKGERSRLYTHVHVREEAFELYGFADREERNCFRLLLGITGVGTKAALSILSTVSPEKFALAVLSDDERTLCDAPGIGKKLAQRVILELKDKLKRQYKPTAQPAGTIAADASLPVDKGAEALMALQVLGYTTAEAAAALRGADTIAMSVEDMIRHALKGLVRP